MMPASLIRRYAMLSPPWIALVAALALALHDHGERRLRFALYRPGTADFILGRGIESGSDLTSAYTATGIVPSGIPGDTGLICPQGAAQASYDYRLFNGGEWFKTPGHALSRARTLALGAASDIPFCADFDGDGESDSGVFRNGQWTVLLANGSGRVEFSFGAPGDTPVAINIAGRGNGTDRRNIVYGVYRAGEWYLDVDGNGVPGAIHRFGGLPGDVPLLIPRWTRNADSAGAYSLVIFRDGIWHLRPDPNGPAVVSFAFGQPGDIPLVKY